MCVPGLFRLAQISLTKAFHRSSAETRIGKTKTKTTTMTITLSQNVVLSDFDQIPSLHFVYTLAPHLFFRLGIIEIIATYSYTTIHVNTRYQGALLGKLIITVMPYAARSIGQVQMISSIIMYPKAYDTRLYDWNKRSPKFMAHVVDKM